MIKILLIAAVTVAVLAGGAARSDPTHHGDEMRNLCGRDDHGHRRLDSPCIFDANGEIVGLPWAGALLVRKIGMHWFQFMFVRAGVSRSLLLFYDDPGC